jgi:hypothetical protein
MFIYLHSVHECLYLVYMREYLGTALELPNQCWPQRSAGGLR